MVTSERGERLRRQPHVAQFQQTPAEAEGGLHVARLQLQGPLAVPHRRVHVTVPGAAGREWRHKTEGREWCHKTARASHNVSFYNL